MQSLRSRASQGPVWCRPTAARRSGRTDGMENAEPALTATSPPARCNSICILPTALGGQCYSPRMVLDGCSLAERSAALSKLLGRVGRDDPLRRPNSTPHGTRQNYLLAELSEREPAGTGINHLSAELLRRILWWRQAPEGLRPDAQRPVPCSCFSVMPQPLLVLLF